MPTPQPIGVISDLSGLVDRQEGNRIVVSGDWNILHGYGEHGSTYWKSRYQTVFDRMKAIGLRFVGPQQPNGQPVETPAEELPAGSLDVPTYRTQRDDPSTGKRQLDFVFASESIADSLTVRAAPPHSTSVPLAGRPREFIEPQFLVF